MGLPPRPGAALAVPSLALRRLGLRLAARAVLGGCACGGFAVLGTLRYARASCPPRLLGSAGPLLRARPASLRSGLRVPRCARAGPFVPRALACPFGGSARPSLGAARAPRRPRCAARCGGRRLVRPVVLGVRGSPSGCFAVAVAPAARRFGLRRSALARPGCGGPPCARRCGPAALARLRRPSLLPRAGLLRRCAPLLSRSGPRA